MPLAVPAQRADEPPACPTDQVRTLAVLLLAMRPLKKLGLGVPLSRGACDLGVGVRIFGRVLLCRVSPEGGSDRVKVDEDACPDGLEGRFSGAAVAALASPIAVDDESEQALDQRPGALEMVALGGVG